MTVDAVAASVLNAVWRLTAASLCVLCFLCALDMGVSALEPDTLRSIDAIPPEIAGRFRDPGGFQQSASGQYFVFDRRGHTVFGVDAPPTTAWEIVQIGGEPGRIIDATAFSVAPNGTFVVADAPNNRERIQIFTPAGFRIGGFSLRKLCSPPTPRWLWKH